VRDADQPALLADGHDRFRDRQAGRDRPLEEDGDEVAVGGPDLLADDDRQAVGRGLASPERTLDSIVIGDREVGQAAGRRSADDGLRRGQAVEARARVTVEVDESRYVSWDQ
jgi:hypothetical protein